MTKRSGRSFFKTHSIPDEGVHHFPSKILPLALERLLEWNPNLQFDVGVIRASGSMCAYRVGPFILVAKTYIYRGMVSVSERVLKKAKFDDLYVVMWIQDINRLYYMKHTWLEGNTETNIFNDQTMYNFSISRMKNINEFDDEKIFRRFRIPFQKRFQQ